MEWIIIIIGLAALLLWLARPKWTRPQVKPLPNNQAGDFALQPSLFVNKAELALYQVLRRACPPDFAVMSKTRMEDVIAPRRGLAAQYRYGLRGRVKSRHFDFLLIDYHGRPLAAIELDGSAHMRPESQINDDVKTALCAGAGLPLYRLNVGEDFTRQSAVIFNTIAQFARKN
ncbi:DUF2726 domain-containing protein [Robiginitomaculum antarcticum]|uniref:DUF2726 domain-containing protein n=1 Tax=Robiginitomaculum antarcticum TaxID=437507 RepID=UPI000375D8C8|nr:DUF2726 domain-containing protein [Robiginitomaculum antarcticum]